MQLVYFFVNKRDIVEKIKNILDSKIKYVGDTIIFASNNHRFTQILTYICNRIGIQFQILK